MKTILAATDFSEASYNATVYANELAKSFNAQLVIYSAYHEMPVILPEMPLFVTPEDMRSFIEEQLKQYLVQLNIENGRSVKTICSEQSAITGILETARANNADLIITGMKSEGKAFRKVLGSTVTSLINKSSVPVLVIPENSKYHPINSISLASEGDLSPDTDKKLFTSLEELASQFKCKLYIVRIVKNEMKAALEAFFSPSTIKRMISKLKPVYQCVEGKDVVTGLKEFNNSHKIDLLVTLSHQHSLVAQWFGISATRNLLFELSVPLLILPVDKFTKQTKDTFSKETIL